ncbi:hypothetical protein DL96DRAFT_1723180 [Flagelloscypha sp. PMI_526]|nr:hypothetical protein DL96DRAFT_1723180 [Flagelloscypha sp. PMI_526]
MRFFTIACAIGASISAISAAHIQGQRELTPRVAILPSGVPVSLPYDGDFEADSDSPWVYGLNGKLIEDSTLCRSSSHLLQATRALWTGSMKYPLTLSPYTQYTAPAPANGVVHLFLRLHRLIPKHTVEFTTSSSGSLDLLFSLLCDSGDTGQWYIDDVTLALATPDNTPIRK